MHFERFKIGYPYVPTRNNTMFYICVPSHPLHCFIAFIHDYFHFLCFLVWIVGCDDVCGTLEVWREPSQ
uniref:Uncharacterized protein n=1 Tax=Arundo donax TaxID=35708 RepID=A0A0A9B314_ARUDO